MDQAWKWWVRMGWPLPPIAGGSLSGAEGPDPGVEGTEGEGVEGAEGEGEGVAEGEGTEGAEGAEGEAVWEEGDRRYTAAQLREALKSHENRQSWERTHKQRDMRDAEFHRVTTQAFGKPPHQLDRVDIADLRSFGGFNARLRSDPEFKQDFEYTLRTMQDPRFRQVFQQALKAAGVAGRREDRPKRPADGEGDLPEPMARLDRRMTEYEQREETRAIMALGDRIEQRIGAAIGSLKDLNTTRWGSWIHDSVLSVLHGYEDAELFAMEADGRLRDEVARIIERAATAIREDVTERQKGRATAAADARRGAPPAPLRGGPARKAPAQVEPVAGRGLSGMSDAFRSDFLGERR